jgi:dihydrodipicolinate synthase/N-acetylneuraminate lyase
VGSATLDLSIALAREAREAGAAGLLLPPPFFFRYEPDDVFEFYKRFAAQLGPGADTFLSNTPASTSQIPVETALDLLQTGLFAGVEDSSGSLESLTCLRAAAAMCSLQLLVGSDQIFTRARCTRVAVPGGAFRLGAVSAAACAVPELLMALDRAITAARTDEIGRLDRALQDFMDWEVRFPQTTIVKVATGLRGLKTGPLSVPLSPGKERLLAEFREWFQGWLPDVKKMSANA